MTSIVLGLVVFCAVMCAIAGFAAVLHWGRHREIGLLPYIYYPVVHNTVWQVLGSNRNLFAVLSTDFVPVEPMHPYVLWASRLTSLYILVGALERIVNRILHYGSGTKSPYWLSAAFFVFFLTTVLFSAFFGAHKSISHEYFYLFIGGMAALLSTSAEADEAVKVCRTSIFACLLLSAFYLIIKPEMVLTEYGEGLIPGFNIRYYGLTSHANTLGPMTVVFLLCLASKPYKAVWVNNVAWVVGVATLIAAQSKTSWIATLLCMPCMAYFRYGALVRYYFFDFRRPFYLASLVMATMVGVTAVALVIMFGPTGNPLSKFFVTQAGADLMSMTGRNEIWEIAVREWRRSPLFGYGLTIWNEEHRARIGYSAAVTAHSQFYQSLSSAGIVGVVGLFIYAVTVLWFVMKTVRISQGLTLGLFLMLALRSISEVPLTMIGYYGPPELTHILILMTIAGAYSALQPVKAKNIQQTVR